MKTSPKPSKRSKPDPQEERNPFDEYTPLARTVVCDVFQNFGIDEVLVAEYRFHPDRLWRADLAMVRSKIMIEFEGGVATHNKGTSKSRHLTLSGFEEDCRKYNEAAALGWCVLRFTPQMVTRGEAGAIINTAWRLRNP